MTVESIKRWFELAVPTPTDKNRNVQFGVHVEEAAEMFEAIAEPSVAGRLHAIGEAYKKGEVALGAVNRDLLLDSLCDQIVTAVGIAHMFGLNINGALAEVNRSNYSKFVDGKPQFDANGKIAKPATYSPPNLAPFL